MYLSFVIKFSIESDSIFTNLKESRKLARIIMFPNKFFRGGGGVNPINAI